MLEKIMDLMKRGAQRHIAADAFQDRGNGCFDGRIGHSSDARALTKRFGIPEPLAHIAEQIFDSLSDTDPDAGDSFLASVPEAIGGDGKDLSNIHWLFLVDCLEHLPDVGAEFQVVVDRVIAGLRLLGAGKKWPKSEADAAADDAVIAMCADGAYHAELGLQYKLDAAKLASRYAAEAAALAYVFQMYIPRACADGPYPVTVGFYSGQAALRATTAAGAAYYTEAERQRDAFLSLLREARKPD